jgi:hypothetical protein
MFVWLKVTLPMPSDSCERERLNQQGLGGVADTPTNHDHGLDPMFRKAVMEGQQIR